MLEKYASPAAKSYLGAIQGHGDAVAAQPPTLTIHVAPRGAAATPPLRRSMGHPAAPMTLPLRRSMGHPRGGAATPRLTTFFPRGAVRRRVVRGIARVQRRQRMRVDGRPIENPGVVRADETASHRRELLAEVDAGVAARTRRPVGAVLERQRRRRRARVDVDHERFGVSRRCRQRGATGSKVQREA